MMEGWVNTYLSNYSGINSYQKKLKVKEPILFNYLIAAGEEQIHDFPTVIDVKGNVNGLVKIRTRITDSISSDDNRYANVLYGTEKTKILISTNN